MLPGARTLQELRKQQVPCGVVERYIPQAKIRQDLFGFIDIIAIRENKIVGIQATTSSNVSSRIAKILESPEIPIQWFRAGGEIEVWGWGKYKVKRGGKAIRWRCRKIRFYLGYGDLLDYREGR